MQCTSSVERCVAACRLQAQRVHAQRSPCVGSSCGERQANYPAAGGRESTLSTQEVGDMRGISSFVRLALPAGAAWAIRSARCRAHVAAVSASALPPARKITLALCQVSVTDDKDENIRVANQAIRGAAAQGAELVVLPEMWNCPYSNDSFPSYAEDIDNDDSPSVAMLSETSKLLGVTVVGGSIPERSGDKLFNTCCVFAPDGRLLAKHRKVHLFDIDIPGGITFRESDTLTAGEGLTVVDTAAGRLGIGICYDLRFPEMATMYAAMGVQMLVYPGAFNMTTGPVHWQLLQQARAVDNQLFVCTCSPARNPDSSYQAWGHSMVVGPFGQIVATTGHEAGTVMVEVDLQEIEERRQNMPLSLQKRADIYRLTGEMPKVRS